MLTAKDQNGRLFTMPPRISKNQAAMLKSLPYYCPCCDHKLIVKAGERKIPHFSHTPAAICTVSAEPESLYHLKGKRLLFNWLSASGMETELERYFPEIRQRADVCAKTKKGRYAYEFQCSPLPPKEISRRTEAYSKIGIRPIWILAHKAVRPRKNGCFSLNSFQWSFLQDGMSRPFIMTLCPEEASIGFFQHFFPFSPSVCFSSFRSFPLAKIQPGMVPVLQPPSFLEEWARKKKAWKHTRFRTAGPNDPLFRSMYLSGLSPSLLPAEIGIPLQGLWKIETGCMEWQYWVYRDVFHEKKEGAYITVGQISRSLMKHSAAGHIKYRRFPMLDEESFVFSAAEYLEMLRKLGRLKPAGAGEYRLCEPLVIPKTEKEAEYLEKHLLNRLKSMIFTD